MPCKHRSGDEPDESLMRLDDRMLVATVLSSSADHLLAGGDLVQRPYSVLEVRL